MWVLKLTLLSSFFYITHDLIAILECIITSINLNPNFNFDYVLDNTLKLAENSVFQFILKLLLAVMLLILVRGGTPRYRYDYLTKLGWLKFIGLIISFFILYLLFYLFL